MTTKTAPPNPPQPDPQAAVTNTNDVVAFVKAHFRDGALIAIIFFQVWQSLSDRDKAIEERLSHIEIEIAKMNTTLGGPSGLAHRVDRLEDRLDRLSPLAHQSLDDIPDSRLAVSSR